MKPNFPPLSRLPRWTKVRITIKEILNYQGKPDIPVLKT